MGHVGLWVPGNIPKGEGQLDNYMCRYRAHEELYTEDTNKDREHMGRRYSHGENGLPREIMYNEERREIRATSLVINQSFLIARNRNQI